MSDHDEPPLVDYVTRLPWRVWLVIALFFAAFLPAALPEGAPRRPPWYSGPFLMLAGLGFLIWREEFAQRGWWWKNWSLAQCRRQVIGGGVAFLLVGVLMLFISLVSG